jgi:hypothetical protein
MSSYVTPAVTLCRASAACPFNTASRCAAFLQDFALAGAYIVFHCLWPALVDFFIAFNWSVISCSLGSILAASDTSCNNIGYCTVGSLYKNTRWIYFRLLQFIISMIGCRFTHHSSDYLDINVRSCVVILFFRSPGAIIITITVLISVTKLNKSFVAVSLVTSTLGP